MKFKTIRSLTLLLACTAAMVHCGSEGSKFNQNQFGLDTVSPFRVRNIDPGYQATFVDRGSEVRIWMTQAIDGGSIDGALTLF